MNLSDQRTAILSTLSGDGTLCAMLAKNSSDNTGCMPAIFLDNRRKPPVYPCITYRFMSATPDDRFRPTNTEGGGESTITENRLEFRIYDPAEVSRRDAILKQVGALMDGKRFTLSTGTIFRAELIIALPDQWDDPLNAFYHHLRYRLRFSA